MTAELRVLLDARGGGFGHAMRGAQLAQAWRARGHEVELLVSDGCQHVLGSCAHSLVRGPLRQAQLPRAELLVVDTFAEGFGGEWNAASLASYPARVLIERHRIDPQPDLRAHYTQTWTPYSAALSEWAEPPQAALPIGLIARDLRLTQQANSPCVGVFDPGQRLDPAGRGLLQRLCTELGRPLRWLSELPSHATLPLSKLLVVGAGYNTFYELARAALDVRFVPLRRRHDDQFARARRLGLALSEPAAVRDWLRSAHHPRQLGALHFATATSLGALL